MFVLFDCCGLLIVICFGYCSLGCGCYWCFCILGFDVWCFGGGVSSGCSVLILLC